jgi:hypothetical protein
MINQSKLIIKHLDGFGGKNVDSVYLGEAYETGKPHVMEGMTMRIFSSKSRFFSSKLVLGMTGGRANGTKEIDNEIYRWKLQGAEEKFARSVENLESGNATAGINNTEFRIKLDLDYFDAPDVLFGEDNEYPLELTQAGIPDGQGTVYTVRIQGDNPNIFFPNYLLEPGREFNKVWTTVASEANDEFGTQQFPNAFELENQLGAFAQSYHVTDKAWRDEGKLEVQFSYTDKEGKEKMASRFLPMAEAKMWDELMYSSLAA